MPRQLSNVDYSNIKYLHLKPSRLQNFINSVTEALAGLVRYRIRQCFSEWFLSHLIILKIEKQGQTELFNTEVGAYSMLRPLQGFTVPRCYGLARFNGMRSLALQNIGGSSLIEPHGLTLGSKELSALLQGCHRELHINGVHQEDPQLSNFRLVNGRIMVLDFERVAFNLSECDRVLFMKTNIEHVATKYHERQVMEFENGNLIAEIGRAHV